MEQIETNLEEMDVLIDNPIDNPVTEITLEENTQVVNPVTATCDTKFNYDLLIEQFGLMPIDSKFLDKMRDILGCEPHYLLRREIFYAHQDFDKILSAKAAGKEIYIYTGRGPSAQSMHAGHLIPMMFTVWLQKVFDCWVVIEMSDEEKFYFKDGTLEHYLSCTEGNARDIIACGFDPEKTFIFSSFKYERYMRPLIANINKKMTVLATKNIYGFNDDSTVGKFQWAPYQMAPALAGAFPHLFGSNKDVYCLIPCAVDQAPYFRSLRDLTNSLGYPKPAIICSKFLVGLQGINQKASTTSTLPPIFLSDSPENIQTKIKKYAFSGGRDTMKEHRELGGNLEIDVSYQYLYYFLDDDTELCEIARAYATGIMLTSQLKQKLITILQKIIGEHAYNRSQITDEYYEKFFTIQVQSHVSEYFKQYSDKYVDLVVKY